MSPNQHDYAPDRGDIIWTTLNPASSHEQAGRRPSLVLSPLAYNEKVGLAVCCPITSRAKGYHFEVELPPDLTVKGVVLADQVRSLSWRGRRAEFAETAPIDIVDDVLAKLDTLLRPSKS